MISVLEEQRRKAGLTQEEVAVVAGVTYQAIGHYEGGRRKLPIEVAKKIAPLLGVDWPQLFEERPVTGS